MADLPGAAVKRLIQQHGGGLRISGSAMSRAVRAAEEYIGRLAREAGAAAEKERRKTIMDSAIQRARESVG